MFPETTIFFYALYNNSFEWKNETFLGGSNKNIIWPLLHIFREVRTPNAQDLRPWTVVKVVLWSRGVGSPDEARLEQTRPIPIPTPLIWLYFRHKITLYRFQSGGGLILLQGGAQMGAGGWAPRAPLTLTTVLETRGLYCNDEWRRASVWDGDASEAGCCWQFVFVCPAAVHARSLLAISPPFFARI